MFHPVAHPHILAATRCTLSTCHNLHKSLKLNKAERSFSSWLVLLIAMHTRIQRWGGKFKLKKITAAAKAVICIQGRCYSSLKQSFPVNVHSRERMDWGCSMQVSLGSGIGEQLEKTQIMHATCCMVYYMAFGGEVCVYPPVYQKSVSDVTDVSSRLPQSSVGQP